MKKKGKPNQVQTLAKAAAKASRDAEIARGWKPRAQTFADRRAVGRRMACRRYSGDE